MQMAIIGIFDTKIIDQPIHYTLLALDKRIHQTSRKMTGFLPESTEKEEKKKITF